jgi:hypothetical protein
VAEILDLRSSSSRACLRGTGKLAAPGPPRRDSAGRPGLGDRDRGTVLARARRHRHRDSGWPTRSRATRGRTRSRHAPAVAYLNCCSVARNLDLEFFGVDYTVPPTVGAGLSRRHGHHGHCGRGCQAMNLTSCVWW